MTPGMARVCEALQQAVEAGKVVASVAVGADTLADIQRYAIPGLAALEINTPVGPVRIDVREKLALSVVVETVGGEPFIVEGHED